MDNPELLAWLSGQTGLSTSYLDQVYNTKRAPNKKLLDWLKANQKPGRCIGPGAPEAIFRWLITEAVRHRGRIFRADAISAGAKLAGCSPSSARDYLSKLTSMYGPLRENTRLCGCILTLRS